MAYATWEDVEARWPGKTFTEDEKTLANLLLEDAAALIDGDYPVADDMSARELRVRLMVSVDLVKGVMDAPNGLQVPGDPTSMQVSIGPFQRSFGGMSAPIGRLVLSRAHRDMLRGRRQRAASVDTLPPLECDES